MLSGHVESSVKIIRNKAFATNFKFNSLNEARTYLSSILIKLNKDSLIEQEKEHLLAYKPKLELANISENEVNSYRFIRASNCFYSVPEYLVGKNHDNIVVYAGNDRVCEHFKALNDNETTVDINHYLITLKKKPGAIKNSLALKSIPELKQIFDMYYVDQPRKFIQILIDNKEKSNNEILEMFKSEISIPQKIKSIDFLGDSSFINIKAKEQTSNYNTLCFGKGN